MTPSSSLATSPAPSAPATRSASTDKALPPPRESTLIWKFCQRAAALLMRIFWDAKSRGTEHIPQTGGVLTVANHESYLDPMLVGYLHRRPMSFLAEAYLFKFKPLGWLFRKVNAFPIQQGRGDVGAMKMLIALLQQGELLNVFPEGSRTPNGKLQAVQGGVALAIRRAKVPVVPVGIAGAYAAWPRHQLAPKFGKVRVVYGPPRELHHLSSSEIVAELEKLLVEYRDKAIAWRDEDA